ncbi:protein spinster homolog 3 isoform X5 [Dama dama]|uniref:protein spinster homolog 3 isoform X5 n=1 Tax=Dama dama TaxID=30532 RepID=UPI002A367439|nr:protein spinster homolog 3 isoform X5 [Dama dama]
MSVEFRQPEGLHGQSPGPGGHSRAMDTGPPSMPAPWSLPRWRAYVAAAVLCYINLLNYMNWFIIAGVLLDVQKFFHISDSNAGLLQTVFISFLLLSAPVFGYLGDRHSRKATLSFGILLWSGAGLSSSFISPRYSWLFFLSRGLVGTGTASYSTIAPTVLGDLFVRDQRTRVLAIFYIFIPVGSGLGYVLGSAVTELTGNWRWALRIMPCLEAVALILLIMLVPDPPRGAAEKQGVATMGDPRSSWCEDVRYLWRNWSFVWSTLGVTAMAFVTGALGFWAPKFLFEARVVHGLLLPCFREPCNSQDRCSWPLGSFSCPATGRWLPTSCCRWWCPGAGGQLRHFRSQWATSWEMPAAPTSRDLSPVPCGRGAPTLTCSASSAFSRASCAASSSSPWAAAASC